MVIALDSVLIWRKRFNLVPVENEKLPTLKKVLRQNSREAQAEDLKQIVCLSFQMSYLDELSVRNLVSEELISSWYLTAFLA